VHNEGMKNRLFALALFFSLAALFPCAGYAQYAALPVQFCVQGAVQASTSGMRSTNYLDGIIPSCQVAVFLTGSPTYATIYSDATGTALANPFTASSTGQFLAYASGTDAYDVVLSGGIAPNTYPMPVTITDVMAGGGGGSPFDPGHVSASPFNLGALVARGDSLTAGYEGNYDRGSYPVTLQQLAGANVTNLGIGGATSTQICAQMGACPTSVTITGGSIPACTSFPCTGVVGTFTSGSQPIIYQGGTNTLVMSIPGVLHSSPIIPVMVTVAAGNVYTFTPTALTPGATVPGAVSFTVTSPYVSVAPIITAGRNNVYTTGAATIASDIAAMVASLPTNQIFVIGSIIKTNAACGNALYNPTGCVGVATGAEWNGTSNSTTINAVNAATAAAYPTEYVDLNAALMAAYNPSLPTDVSDVANGIPPTSLRAINQMGTLTNTIGAGTTGGVSTCNILISYPSVFFPQVGAIVTIDDGTTNAENVLVVTSDEPTTNTILTCVRGYGGNPNIAHNAGAVVTETDGIHLRKEGYDVLAKAFAAKLEVLPSPVVTQTDLLAALGGIYANGGFKSWDVNNTVAGGGQALGNLTTGSSDTAVGWAALYADTTGGGNTAVGETAMQATTTGNQNTAVGGGALVRNTTGSYNTADGYFSLYFNTTGSQNTAYGYQSGFNSTVGPVTAFGYTAATGTMGMTGSHIDAFGQQAAFSITSGAQDVAVGDYALNNTTTGSYNTAVGYGALQTPTTVSGNTAVGFSSFRTSTSGTNNVGLGFEAGGANTSGSNNSFGGYNAGLNATTGSNNSAWGTNALSAITTGNGNTALGYDAGYVYTTTTNGTFLGSSARSASDALTDITCIGYNSLCTASHEVVLGGSTVTDVYTGSVTPAATVHAAAYDIGSVTKVADASGNLYDTALGSSTAPLCTTTGGLLTNSGCSGGGGGAGYPATPGVAVCVGTPCTAWTTSLSNVVTGPGSGATVGHLAVMGNTSGTSITDGGAVPSGGSGNSVCPTASSLGFLLNGTDETTTLNTLLGTFYTAGGGCVAIDAGKTLRADGQIVIPKAVSTPWAATPVRITGSTNPMASADALATPTGGSTLDLRYAGNRILALGQGTVEIDHNLIKNGGTSCGTFIYSTLAVMKIHDNTFFGYAGGGSPCDDVWVAGSTNPITRPLDGTVGDYFNAYGAFENDNFADQIRHLLVANTAFNGITVENNTVWNRSGNTGAHATADGAPLVIYGDASYLSLGNKINGNLFELVNYTCGIWVHESYGNKFDFNVFYDNASAFAYCGDNTSGHNMVFTNNGSALNGIATGFIDTPTIIASDLSRFGGKVIHDADVSFSSVTVSLNNSNVNNGTLNPDYMKLPWVAGNRLTGGNCTAGQTIVSGGALDTDPWACSTPAAAQVAANLASSGATGVTGILPIANGGTGVSTTAPITSVFAGPPTGSPGAPSFQTAPTISAANMTSFPTLNQSTSGTALTATNLAGTGVDYAPYQSASATTGYIVAPTTTGHTFVYAWQPSGSAIAPTAVDANTLVVSSAGSATSATTATNIAGGLVGGIPYQTAAGATSLLAGNTAATDQALISHGTGAAGLAPTLLNNPALSAANMTAFPTALVVTVGNDIVPCSAGLYNGGSAITVGTYTLSGRCLNVYGATYTITGVKCYSDNNGSSTGNLADSAANPLLNAAITATNTWAAGTQSATTTIAANVWVNWTLVADGTSTTINCVMTEKH